MDIQHQDNNSYLLHEKHSMEYTQPESRTLSSTSSVEQSVVLLGIEASQYWPQNRTIHLAKLCAQIEAGVYSIDNNSLATRIISNETNFFKSQAN